MVAHGFYRDGGAVEITPPSKLLTWAAGIKMSKLTFQRGETAIEDQLEIAKLSLAQDDGGKRLGFRSQLALPGGIARNQILEDSAMGRVGHLEEVYVIWDCAATTREEDNTLGKYTQVV